MKHILFAALPLIFASSPAQAEDRPFCANRPGLGTPACTLAPGQAMVELGAASWERSKDPVSVTDVATQASALIRLGVSDRAEVQVGLDLRRLTRTRDLASGTLSRSTGIGDLTIGLRRGLGRANGPVAVQAYVTLPTASGGQGAGTWGAGLQLPIGIDLPGDFTFALTPGVSAAPDQSGTGRHFAYGSVAGLSRNLTPALSGAVEVAVQRDLDPAGHTTSAVAALSLAWQVAEDWQVDVQATVGLNAAAPRRAFAIGLAKRL